MPLSIVEFLKICKDANQKQAGGKVDTEDVYVSFKVTPDEEKLIQIAARLQGIHPKEYLRQKMLGIAAEDVLETSALLDKDDASRLGSMIKKASY